MSDAETSLFKKFLTKSKLLDIVKTGKQIFKNLSKINRGNEMSFCKLSQKNQITIPKNLAEKLDLHPGDLFEIKNEGFAIILFPKRIPSDQAWFWTKEWQEKEQEADKDIRSGEISEDFENAEDLIKHLRNQKDED